MLSTFRNKAMVKQKFCFLCFGQNQCALNEVLSSHIEAIIEVTQIIDEYSIYACSSIVEDDVLIEFESAADYKVGERVLVIGSLELREREEEAGC